MYLDGSLPDYDLAFGQGLSRATYPPRNEYDNQYARALSHYASRRDFLGSFPPAAPQYQDRLDYYSGAALTGVIDRPSLMTSDLPGLKAAFLARNDPSCVTDNEFLAHLSGQNQSPERSSFSMYNSTMSSLSAAFQPPSPKRRGVDRATSPMRLVTTSDFHLAHADPSVAAARASYPLSAMPRQPPPVPRYTASPIWGEPAQHVQSNCLHRAMPLSATGHAPMFVGSGGSPLVQSHLAQVQSHMIQSSVETDPVRLRQRQKQIDYGKNTRGYERYMELVPKHRRRRSDPRTPDKHQKYSKRAWDGLVRKWRRDLHRWDPPEDLLASSSSSASTSVNTSVTQSMSSTQSAPTSITDDLLNLSIAGSSVTSSGSDRSCRSSISSKAPTFVDTEVDDSDSRDGPSDGEIDDMGHLFATSVLDEEDERQGSQLLFERGRTVLYAGAGAGAAQDDSSWE